MAKSPLSFRKYFKNEAVVVKYQQQARPIIVNRLPLPDPKSMPTVSGGFQPFRMVINLKVVEAKPLNGIITHFDPPIEIRVRFTDADLNKAKASNATLALGYWDGIRWVRCTPGAHLYHLELERTGRYAGWAVIKISHWTDPTLAVGT